MKDWFSKNSIWITGAFLTIASGIIHFFAVDQTRHPTGFDGYYYVMQVHSYLTYGHLQSLDSSLIYPFLIFISGFAGDAITGFKVGVTILSMALVGSVFWSLWKRQVPLMTIALLCAWLLFSPTLTFFLNQFPKNALGLVFLILFVSFLDRKGVAAIFLIATLLSHRMTGAMAIVIYGCTMLKGVSWKWIVTGAIVVAGVSLLPGILHVSDLKRLDGQFSITPQWAPYSFFQTYCSSMDVWWIADLIILTLLFPIIIVLAYIRRKSRSFEDLIWIAAVSCSMFPFLLFDAGTIGFRVFLIVPVAIVLALPSLVKVPQMPGAVAFAAILGLSFLSWRSYNPALLDPPNAWYEGIASELQPKYSPKQYSLVIVHKSLAELIIFRTEFDALNWLPPENIPPSRVLRIVNGIDYFSLKHYLEPADLATVKGLKRGYLATPEDVWQRFVGAVRESGDKNLLQRIYASRNPMEKRPYFLEKGKTR